MDLELNDSDSLKCNILQLLISYPNGITFGNFVGAFYQIHHFHPQLSHYGYSSLRHLLDDMRETVVVEGNNSCDPIMKLVNGLNLDGLLGENENNGLDGFKEEDSRLKEEEEKIKREEETAEADLAEVLAAVTNLLVEYQSGLKLEKIQTLLLSTIGIDLQTFSVTKGYKDVLTFLRDQIPNLIIRRRGNLHKCVAQLSKDLTVVSVPICSILKLYPDGLKLSKLKEAVKKKCGYDLDVFCYQVGYSDIVSCLQEIPELIINRNKNRNCRVQLKSASFSYSSSQSSHSPSLDSGPSICISKNVNQAASEKKPVSFGYSSSYSSSSDSDQSTGTSNNSNKDESKKKPVLSEVMALVTAQLRKYKMGLRINKLQDFLLADEEIDLEKFSNAQGYKDTLEFLEQKMPQLLLSYQTNRLNTVVIEPHSVLSKVMALLTALLSKYVSGLKVKKIQEILLVEEGIDLERFSFALGHKDTVEFLEQKMPHLMLNYRTSRLNTVVIEPHSVSLLESPGTADQLNPIPDVSTPLLKSIGTANPLNSAPAQSSYFSSDSEESTCIPNNLNQDESEKWPERSEVMALVIALLSNYKKGLRIWKLQDFLLTDEEIDLEKFSIAMGYKDTVEFLEQKLPQLTLNYQTNRLNTVVIGPHSDLEDSSKPASIISGLSASDSQCQNIPTSIAAVPPEVNNLLHTNQSGPSTMSSNFPSFQEPHNTLSVKAKSPSVFSSIVLPKQPKSCQLNAKVVTEKISSNSHMTTFQPSTVQDEVKQQVAQILAKHPKGMSLFQFRIAYSATFKQHFPVGNAASTKQRLLEMPDIVYMKGHGVQALLLPVSPNVSPAKPGHPTSSKVENVAAVPSLALVHHVPLTKPGVKTFDSHSVWTSPLNSPEKPGSKDCCISKDLSLSKLVPQCQDQEKARTSLTGFSDQLDLSKAEDIPVLPSHYLPKNELLIVPQSFLAPAVPGAAMMPIPMPHPSFLQYYQSIRPVENKGNKPFTELHTQSIPGSIKIMQTNTSHLNGPDPKLREIPFIPHCPAALPTYSQGTVCSENLQPRILKPRFASPTNSKISDALLPLTPVPSVLVKPSEIYSPRRTSQNSNSIQPVLPVQPSPPILSTEQRNYNHAIAEFNSFSEVQKQYRASQHFLSSDSPGKRSSISSLPRNSTSCFPSRSQPDHQQPTHGRLDDLQSISVSLADKSLIKASLDNVCPVAMYQRKSTYVNPLETSSTAESFINCSINGSLHTSSVTTNHSRASSSVSLRTRAVSPASSPLDFTTNSHDQISYASAQITSNSSLSFSENQASTQQRQYAAVISNTKSTRLTSLSPESTTSSHHQFACASSRITTNSSALSSETYAFTHKRQNIQASEIIIESNTKTTSSVSSESLSSLLDSTTSLPCQHACASCQASSTSSVLSKSTTYRTPDADLKTSLNHDPSSQNNLISSLSKQEDQSASLQEKQVPDTCPPSRNYERCLIL